MAKNNKPILSVLVDEEKKERFSTLAKEHNYSMGWLLNQAIDKMLEAGTIHIYRDSILPIDGAATKSLLVTDIEEAVRSYVDKALSPINDDLLNLQTQVAEMKGASLVDLSHWDELKAEVGYLRSCIDNGVPKDYLEQALLSVYVAIDEVKTKLTTAKAVTTREPMGKAKLGESDEDSGLDGRVKMLVKRFRNEPELKSLVEAAIKNGMSGGQLASHLFEKGYGSKNDTKPYGAAVGSDCPKAIEYLSSVNNGA